MAEQLVTIRARKIPDHAPVPGVTRGYAYERREEDGKLAVYDIVEMGPADNRAKEMKELLLWIVQQLQDDSITEIHLEKRNERA